MKKVYELKKATREFRAKSINELSNDLYEGCTLDGRDIDDEIVKTFNTLEEAKKELKKYKTYVNFSSYLGGILCNVKEYFIKETTYDDDGWENIDDFLGYEDFTEFPDIF